MPERSKSALRSGVKTPSTTLKKVDYDMLRSESGITDISIKDHQQLKDRLLVGIKKVKGQTTLGYSSKYLDYDKNENIDSRLPIDYITPFLISNAQERPEVVQGGCDYYRFA